MENTVQPPQTFDLSRSLVRGHALEIPLPSAPQLHEPEVEEEPDFYDYTGHSESEIKGVATPERSSGFDYDSLDSTGRNLRLLKIHSDNDRNTFYCDLEAFSLDNCPPYIALSYTWDHDAGSQEVQCNGQPLRIAGNIVDFLEQFIQSGKAADAHLWIDAICIDQTNIFERNHQVSMMRDIYSGASSVIVWLGDDADDAQAAFNMVEGPHKLALNSTYFRWNRSPKQWKALEKLFSRPYWSRVWIIQEFMIAHSVDIWCGALSANFTSFEQLFERLARITASSSTHPPSAAVVKSQGCVLCKDRSLWQSTGCLETANKRFTLRQLLYAYSASRSSDMRDKVYALLGITNDALESQHPIVADYSKKSVEVLVDVLRNQCRWGDPSQEKANRGFLKLLKDSLQVSSAEFAMHVMQHAPDLQRYAHVFKSSEYVYSSLRCIGSAQSDVEAAMTFSCERTFRDWVLEKVIKNDHEKWLVSAARAELVAQMNDQDILNVGNVDFSKCFATEQTTERQDCDIVSLPSLDTRDDQRDGDKVFQRTSQEIEGNKPLSLFFGTDDLLGVTPGNLKAGDLICAAPGDAIYRRALIMRPSESKDHWTIVTVAAIFSKRAFQHFAHLVETAISIYFPLGTTTPTLPPTKRPKLPWKNRQPPPRSTSLVGKEFRFYWHPTCLPYFARTKLLSTAFVPRAIDFEPVHHVGVDKMTCETTHDGRVEGEHAVDNDILPAYHDKSGRLGYLGLPTMRRKPMTTNFFPSVPLIQRSEGRSWSGSGAGSFDGVPGKGGPGMWD